MVAAAHSADSYASSAWARRRLLLRAVGRGAANVAGWTSVFVLLLDRGASLAQVAGRSMQPTLNPDENRLVPDTLLLNKYVAFTRQWQRGDVVALRSPTDPNRIITKRLVALEDDVVIPNPLLRRRPDVPLAAATPIRIPKGHAWVEGDAGLHSQDSSEYGPVPVALLTARVDAIVWPWRRRAWIRGDAHRSPTKVIPRDDTDPF